MTSTSSGQSSDPIVEPGEAPERGASRPHGDPVLPDPAQNPGAPGEDAGSPAEPQTFPQTDPEADSDPDAAPGQMPESTNTEVGA